MRKVYKSEIGYANLILVFVLVLFMFGLVYYENAPTKMYWIFAGFGGLLFGYMIYCQIAFQYIIQNHELLIKCGPIYKKSIPVNSIKSISKTSVLLISPAPSFDRIELIYNKFDSLVISPKNKTDFAKDLLKINPKITNKLS